MDDEGSAPEPEQAGVAAVTVERQACCPLRAVRPVTGVVTQVGKAPPSPEMTISGLTESGLSGRIKSPDLDNPRLCRTCGPPLQAGCFVLGGDSPQPKSAWYSAPAQARSQTASLRPRAIA